MEDKLRGNLKQMLDSGEAKVGDVFNFYSSPELYKVEDYDGDKTVRLRFNYSGGWKDDTSHHSMESGWDVEIHLNERPAPSHASFEELLEQELNELNA